VTIALVSKTSIEARWVNFEAGVAVGAHDNMPVIPVVFGDLQLRQIGHPLSPKMGRSLGVPSAVRALVQDLSQHAAAEQLAPLTDDEIEKFVSEVKALERGLDVTSVVLLPTSGAAAFNAVRIRFKLHNGGNRTIRPTRVEIKFPLSWLSNHDRTPIRDVLEIEDRNEGAVVFRRITYKRTVRQPNPRIESFTPLPDAISPKEAVNLQHLEIELLRQPTVEQDLSLGYRICADDMDVAEGRFSFDDLLRKNGG
jgi:hypothetical protein